MACVFPIATHHSVARHRVIHINPVARRMLLRRRLCNSLRCGTQCRLDRAPLRITPRTAMIEADHVHHAHRRDSHGRPYPAVIVRSPVLPDPVTELASSAPRHLRLTQSCPRRVRPGAKAPRLNSAPLPRTRKQRTELQLTFAHLYEMASSFIHTSPHYIPCTAMTASKKWWCAAEPSPERIALERPASGSIHSPTEHLVASNMLHQFYKTRT